MIHSNYEVLFLLLLLAGFGCPSEICHPTRQPQQKKKRQNLNESRCVNPLYCSGFLFVWRSCLGRAAEMRNVSPKVEGVIRGVGGEHVAVCAIQHRTFCERTRHGFVVVHVATCMQFCKWDRACFIQNLLGKKFWHWRNDFWTQFQT